MVGALFAHGAPSDSGALLWLMVMVPVLVFIGVCLCFAAGVYGDARSWRRRWRRGRLGLKVVRFGSAARSAHDAEHHEEASAIGEAAVQ